MDSREVNASDIQSGAELYLQEQLILPQACRQVFVRQVMRLMAGAIHTSLILPGRYRAPSWGAASEA